MSPAPRLFILEARKSVSEASTASRTPRMSILAPLLIQKGPRESVLNPFMTSRVQILITPDPSIDVLTPRLIFPGSIDPTKGTIDPTKGSIEGSRRSIESSRRSVDGSGRSIEGSGRSIEVSGGSFDGTGR